jgi:hypothetical protein
MSVQIRWWRSFVQASAMIATGTIASVASRPARAHARRPLCSTENAKKAIGSRKTPGYSALAQNSLSSRPAERISIP